MGNVDFSLGKSHGRQGISLPGGSDAYRQGLIAGATERAGKEVAARVDEASKGAERRAENASREAERRAEEAAEEEAAYWEQVNEENHRRQQSLELGRRVREAQEAQDKYKSRALERYDEIFSDGQARIAEVLALYNLLCSNFEEEVIAELPSWKRRLAKKHKDLWRGKCPLFPPVYEETARAILSLRAELGRRGLTLPWESSLSYDDCVSYAHAESVPELPDLVPSWRTDALDLTSEGFECVNDDAVYNLDAWKRALEDVQATIVSLHQAFEGLRPYALQVADTGLWDIEPQAAFSLQNGTPASGKAFRLLEEHRQLLIQLSAGDPIDQVIRTALIEPMATAIGPLRARAEKARAATELAAQMVREKAEIAEKEAREKAEKETATYTELRGKLKAWPDTPTLALPLFQPASRLPETISTSLRAELEEYYTAYSEVTALLVSVMQLKVGFDKSLKNALSQDAALDAFMKGLDANPEVFRQLQSWSQAGVTGPSAAEVSSRIRAKIAAQFLRIALRGDRELLDPISASVSTIERLQVQLSVMDKTTTRAFFGAFVLSCWLLWTGHWIIAAAGGVVTYALAESLRRDAREWEISLVQSRAGADPFHCNTMPLNLDDATVVLRSMLANGTGHND